MRPPALLRSGHSAPKINAASSKLLDLQAFEACPRIGEQDKKTEVPRKCKCHSSVHDVKINSRDPDRHEHRGGNVITDWLGAEEVRKLGSELPG